MTLDMNDNKIPAPYDYTDKLIYLDENETIMPLEPDSDINISLKLSRSFHAHSESRVPFAFEMASSPEFHELVKLLIEGEFMLREFGALCYMAGRLSLALPGRE